VGGETRGLLLKPCAQSFEKDFVVRLDNRGAFERVENGLKEF
jgi:hypothetical protein